LLDKFTMRAVAVMVLLASVPAMAQAPSRLPVPSSVLSMPADTVVGERRTVTLTQMTAAGDAIGTPLVLDCPRTGCEGLLTLSVEETPWRFFANVSFVSKGLYVTLQSRTIGILRVAEFRGGHQGPSFLPFKNPDADKREVNGDIAFSVIRDGSVREQERGSDPNTVSGSALRVIKREPDIMLRVEATGILALPKPAEDANKTP
jgi:hypothetical protein